MQTPAENLIHRARWEAALTRLLPAVSERQRPKIRILLASSADPESAAHYLAALQERQPAAFARIVEEDAVLQAALAVFSHSRFLSEEILQHPEWIEKTVSDGDLYRVRSTEEMAQYLDAWLSECELPLPLALATFRRRQILRILVRDVLGEATLSEVTEELSNLADAILDRSYRILKAELVQRHGQPLQEGSEGPQECGFSILALGKLGGRELNYSSDIDLMFLYEANGETAGPVSITNKEFYKKLSNRLTELLSTHTAEGWCYRIDLRLRPDGRLGEVCISLDGARNYYSTRARDWELQMLIKARVAAGEPAPGRQLLEFVQPRIYSSTTDFSALESVSLTRERIHERLAARRPGEGLDIKLTRGGIRDIEFLVQCLQRLHGGREPWIKHASTLQALFRLNDKGLLSESEYSRLASAYQFLRHLEHRLQFAEDRQTHTLPTDPGELDLLARRMPPSEIGRVPSGEKLLRQLQTHLEDVQEIYDRVIHAQQPIYYGIITHSPEDPPREPPSLAVPESAPSNLVRHLDVRAPGFVRVLAQRPLSRGLRELEHFLEKVLQTPALLQMLDSDPQLAEDVIAIFELSQYFGQELIRTPELMEELARMRSQPPPNFRRLFEPVDDMQELRRLFRREMFRIQAESLCLCSPIFDTLAHTSDLADAVISAVYRLAVAHVSRQKPPEDPAYQPHQQMMIIALGRLGMREFDLASDADLNFVLPDEDTREISFWTRVASRMIELIGAYTGEGKLFTVDTRLRPNGREGALVQSAGAYLDYIDRRAEAWEGISHMKARAVAGDLKKGTDFLKQVQQTDWRRYGQGGRSRADLRSMRARLENEQGRSNPLKAGYGGYYDIDFVLMYLRLKGAGMFFDVLNTPERIDVIERMGHLDRSEAELLLTAATYYRAIDHAMRLFFGHAEGTLPKAEAHLQVLTRLVQRWVPNQLTEKPLPIQLREIQHSVRRFFQKVFGS